MNQYPKSIFWKPVTKVSKKILDTYSPEEIEYMIDFLTRYSGYCAEKICIWFPNKNNTLLSEKDVTVIERINSQPDFRISLRWWWRMWPCNQSYHSLSQSGRLLCQINQEPIQEIDLQWAGLQFINILTGGGEFFSLLKNDLIHMSCSHKMLK